MERVSRIGLCVLISACGYPPLDRPLDAALAAPTADSSVTAPADAASFCYGSSTSIVKVCLDAAPSNALSITNLTTIDTTSSPMCASNIVAGGAGYCVIAATDIALEAVLRGTGSKPLVLIASGSITGTNPDAGVDVSSRRSGAPLLGAGHDPATCKPAAATPQLKGGGAGGSCISKGGDGGNGELTTNTAGHAADAIAANAVVTLRGGCAGQDGDASTGSAGHGGGGVFLISKTKIELAGTILAGGQGGAGAAAGQGGGGGAGTGGMIGFDAPSIHVANGVYANGAGGGGGISGGNNAGSNGTDSSGAGPAAGGDGGANAGGNGGSGSAQSNGGVGVTASAGITNNTGGGGGGGGVGIIKAPIAANFNNKVYPAPTP